MTVLYCLRYLTYRKLDLGASKDFFPYIVTKDAYVIQPRLTLLHLRLPQVETVAYFLFTEPQIPSYLTQAIHHTAIQYSETSLYS